MYERRTSAKKARGRATGTSDATQAAQSTSAEADSAQHPDETTTRSDAVVVARRSVAKAGRSAAAQGKSQTLRQLAAAAAVLAKDKLQLRIDPVPPQDQVGVMLSGGGPARLLRFLRVRCKVSGDTIWTELIEMIQEPMTECAPESPAVPSIAWSIVCAFA